MNLEHYLKELVRISYKTMELHYHNINNKKIKKYINTLKIMALSYKDAIAALLNNGKNQVLPISMANLIELAANKEKFGTDAQSVQDALSYLAGSFAHANTVAKEAQDNAYAYVGQEINKLDVAKVGSDTDKDHNKFIYLSRGRLHSCICSRYDRCKCCIFWYRRNCC